MTEAASCAYFFTRDFIQSMHPCSRICFSSAVNSAAKRTPACQSVCLLVKAPLQPPSTETLALVSFAADMTVGSMQDPEEQELVARLKAKYSRAADENAQVCTGMYSAVCACPCCVILRSSLAHTRVWNRRWRCSTGRCTGLVLHTCYARWSVCEMLDSQACQGALCFPAWLSASAFVACRMQFPVQAWAAFPLEGHGILKKPTMLHVSVRSQLCSQCTPSRQVITAGSIMNLLCEQGAGWQRQVSPVIWNPVMWRSSSA